MSEKPSNTASEQPETPKNLEQQVESTLENHEAPAQQTPGQEAPERQPDKIYQGIVDSYIDKFAGELASEERTRLSGDLLERIKNINVQTNDELVVEYGKIIKDLQELARLNSGEVSSEESHENNTEDSPEVENDSSVERPAGVPNTKEVVEAQKEVEANKGKYSWKQKARMVLGLPSLGVMSIVGRKNKFARAEGETDAEYDKRTKKHRWSLGALAVAGSAAYFGYRVWANTRGLDANDSFEGHNLGADINGDSVVDGNEQAIAGGFGYDFADDPFNGENKTGVHNWGNPLEHRGGETMSGLTDMQDRWKESPEQMSTVAAEMGLDGFTTENIEEMAEKMKGDPEFAQKTHEALQAILNDSDTKISEGTPLVPGTYGSYFETMVDKDGVVSYDETINEAGSVIKVEYVDAEGNTKVVEFKRECGGQVIHRHPVAEVVPPTGTGEEVPVVPAPAPEGYVPPTAPTPEQPSNPPGTGGGENPTPEPEPEPEPNDGKQWDKQIDTEMDPLGVTAPTEDFATSGNGTESPSITGQEQPGSANPNVGAEGAQQGTGEGIVTEGPGRAEADGNQSSESAVEQSTQSTEGVDPGNPTNGRVE